MAKVQRQWKSQIQQAALAEFELVRSVCPDGIFLCLTPGNFALWSGVLFVRKGPYASAVLRFQLAFPQNYPSSPPIIIFTNDLFHPLVTPLTTYTYSTRPSAAINTVSASDDERLLPGGLSLRHGFPSWFESDEESENPTGAHFRRLNDSSSPSHSEAASETGSTSAADRPTSETRGRPAQSIFQPPPKDDSTSLEDAHPTLLEVLKYVKDVFEDEGMLDLVPIEAAGNPGAWHAWQAYRRRSTRSGSKQRQQQQQQPPSRITPAKSRQAGWNWDGVWADRVKKAIGNSLAESTLYGGVDSDDLIQFLDLEEEACAELRAPFQSRDVGVR